MSRQSLGCKTCPACRSSLMCPAAQPGQARVQCSECRRRGVITHFCLLCEQTWKASSMRQEASCGNLSCQATKITVLELMRVGGLPENRKTIGNITNVPDNRSCPRKECRRKFGQLTSMQTAKDWDGADHDSWSHLEPARLAALSPAPAAHDQCTSERPRSGFARSCDRRRHGAGGC